MNDVYLEHHGVKGMKWGVRRYHNKDGTLTPKGRNRLLEDARMYERKANTSVAENYFAKSRRAKLQQKAKDARYEVRKSDLAKARVKQKVASKSKTVKDMTDDELRDYVIKAENRRDLEARYAKLNPKEISKGKRIVRSFSKTFLKAPVEDVGRQLTKSMMVKITNDYILPAMGMTDDEYRTHTNNKKK